VGRLTVIELDRDLARRLREHPQLDVVESDVLKVDFTALAARLARARAWWATCPTTSPRPSCFTC
jgi:16S rRNA (adenine1518-N6/adenine1519-N6)-dimethyltransferase